MINDKKSWIQANRALLKKPLNRSVPQVDQYKSWKRRQSVFLFYLSLQTHFVLSFSHSLKTLKIKSVYVYMDPSSNENEITYELTTIRVNIIILHTRTVFCIVLISGSVFGIQFIIGVARSLRKRHPVASHRIAITTRSAFFIVLGRKISTLNASYNKFYPIFQFCINTMCGQRFYKYKE